MVFAHDTEVSLRAVAGLVNTRPTAAAPDALASQADLDAFLVAWEWSGSRTHDQAELLAVHDLRDVLARWWSCTRDEAAVLTNDLLRQHRALPQLTRHDHWDYHLHGTDDDAPLATRMAVEAAMAMVDVIRVDEMSRLLRCTADDCDDVFVDLSRNRSKKFCNTTCSNRVAVAAFRARQAQDGR